MFDVFISKWLINRDKNSDDIHFEIEKVKSRLKNNKRFDTKTKLNNLIQDDTSSVGISRKRNKFNANVSGSTGNRGSKPARPKLFLKQSYK